MAGRACVNIAADARRSRDNEISIRALQSRTLIASDVCCADSESQRAGLPPSGARVGEVPGEPAGTASRLQTDASAAPGPGDRVCSTWQKARSPYVRALRQWRLSFLCLWQSSRPHGPGYQ